MRRSLVVLLCAVSSLPATPPAAARTCATRVEQTPHGSWQARSVLGLRGERTSWHLAADEREPRFVMIADLEGIVMTHDGGCSWTRAVEYAEHTAPLGAAPIDAVVAGTGTRRSLHVLVSKWMWAETGATLLSSFDDGATWTATGVPHPGGPSNFVSYSLAASPSSPGVVYLLTRHPTATGGVYAGSGRDDWRRQSTTAYAAPESCAPDGTCTARTIEVLAADPGARGVLWALAGPVTKPDFTLGRSEDGGRSWAHRVAPDPLTGTPLLDVAAARSGTTITSIGVAGHYALSRDAGRSWAVGRLPEVGSDASSKTAFDVAHFDRGRAVATVLGQGPSSGWAGNVMVFDGDDWVDASPRAFSGYERSDSEGRALAFAALASTEGPLLALTSRAELMSFRL